MLQAATGCSTRREPAVLWGAAGSRALARHGLPRTVLAWLAKALTKLSMLSDEFFLNRDWPKASAVAIAMLLLLVVPIMIFQRFQNKELQAAKK